MLIYLHQLIYILHSALHYLSNIKVISEIIYNPVKLILQEDVLAMLPMALSSWCGTLCWGGLNVWISYFLSVTILISY